jgi:UDP:flavonoid glycosyltransferase YjiC (YdhE family)
VYVSESTTEESPLPGRALRELRSDAVDLVVAACGHRDLAPLRALAPNAHVGGLFPTRAAMESADVAVVEGGHSTGLEAARAGTPMIVVPYRAEQWLWADRVERLGTGRALRPPVRPGALRRAVRSVLSQERYREAAALVARDLARWDGPALTADLVEELVPA